MSLPSHIDYLSVEGKKNRKKLISPILNKKNKDFWTINFNIILIGAWELSKVAWLYHKNNYYPS